MHEERGKVETDNLGRDVNQIGALGRMPEGNQLACLVKWINSMLPHLNLPLETSEEELRALLSDGSALCIILDKLVPGSVEIGSDSPSEQGDVKNFLAAIDELGLPGFKFSDLEQGSMVPVLQCLETMKTHFAFNVGQEDIRSSSRKRWDQPDVASLKETDCCHKDVSKFRDSFGNKERLKISVDSKFQHSINGSVFSGIMIYFFWNRKK